VQFFAPQCILYYVLAVLQHEQTYDISLYMTAKITLQLKTT